MEGQRWQRCLGSRVAGVIFAAASSIREIKYKPYCESNMNTPMFLLRTFKRSHVRRLDQLRHLITGKPHPRPRTYPECRQPWLLRRGYAVAPADNPHFQSLIDGPPQLVNSGRRHGPGLLVLCKRCGSFQCASQLMFVRAHSRNCI